jgi:hypothetical protein
MVLNACLPASGVCPKRFEEMKSRDMRVKVRIQKVLDGYSAMPGQ